MAEKTVLHDAAAHAGAHFVEEAGWLTPGRFGDPVGEYERARTDCVLFDLSHHGKIDVTGPEAARYLHNLTTNDVVNLPPGAGCEAFLASAKARVVAYLYLYHHQTAERQSAFHLHLPPGTAEKTLQHLDRYHISEQIELSDRTADLAHVYLVGPQAHAVLEKAAGEALPPLPELGHTTAGDWVVRRRDALGAPGFSILVPNERAESLWRRLTEAGAHPAGREAYEVLRVEAGTPAWGLDIDENTFVPEVGRTKQAICYTKGCYLGQEPIVMARDRGHVNRTLLGLKLNGDPAPHGSLLHRDSKEVGRVTSSVVSPRLGTAVALGYLRRGCWEPGTAVEVEVEGTRRPAVVSALPIAG